MRAVIPTFGLIQKKLGALNTVLQENLAGVRVVQAFAREPYEAARYTAMIDDLLDVNLRLLRAFSNNFPLIFLIANLGGGHLDRRISGYRRNVEFGRSGRIQHLSLAAAHADHDAGDDLGADLARRRQRRTDLRDSRRAERGR
jgi:hypothetical protein